MPPFPMSTAIQKARSALSLFDVCSAHAMQARPANNESSHNTTARA